jgi:phytoene dehydrogenase-like protein
VGSGPNGLVAANLLADRGWDVLVLEASTTPGGAVRSAELMEAGFVNDVCSAFYPLGAASPWLGRLGLEAYGLRWRHAPLVLAHPALDGTCPVLSRDVEETSSSLDALHPGDGDGWRTLYERWTLLGDPLIDALFSAFPPVRATARLARRVSRRDYADVARFLLLPVRRLGEEFFGGDGARRLLAGAALHADLGPEATMSGFFGWLLCALGQQHGFPVPESGAGALTDALAARLVARGGSVVCDRRVDRVLTRDGRAVGVQTQAERIEARRAVLADVAAPALYRCLLDENDVPARIKRRIDRFQWDNGTVKVDWNLDGPIPWSAEAARRAGTVHLAESVDALTRASAELACGAVPDDPFLIVGQQSMTDPTRQPPGAETAWAYTHVPFRAAPAGAALGEDGSRVVEEAGARWADRMEAVIERHAPGFRDRIRQRHVLTPSCFERENANLVGGALAGGTAQLHQQLIFRPVPGLGRPETPVRSLYLASAFAHPGGGVHGGPGANAARAALLHDRLHAIPHRFGRPRARR